MLPKIKIQIGIVSLLLLSISTLALAAEDGLKKESETIRSALPTFATVMHEVNERFRDMYYAAHGGNWGLASYMSKHIDSIMKSTKVIEPKVYDIWETYYETMFGPINKGIMGQDLKLFENEYDKTIESCNLCHQASKRGFIKVIKMREPADKGIDYLLKTNPTGAPQ